MRTIKHLWGIVTCALLSLCISCTEEEKEAPIGGTVTDENGPITLELTDLTATTAIFKGSVNLEQYSKYDEVGIIYSLTEDLEIKPLVTNVVPITNIDKNNRFEKKMRNLLHGTKYYYSSYICMNGIYKFGEVQSFTTEEVKMEVSAPSVTSTTATFKGKVTVKEDDLESLSFCIAWSQVRDFEVDVNEEEVELEDDGTFTLTVEGLKMNKEYYYSTCISQLESKYGEQKTFTTASAAMSVSASQITQTTVTFTGQAEQNKADTSIEYGILYSTDEKLEVGASGCVRKVLTDEFDANGNYSLKVDGLVNDTKYNYCWYARQGSEYKYGMSQQFTTSSVTINLSVTPITQTTATFTGNYQQPDGDGIEIGILYSLSSELKANQEGVEKIVLTEANFRHEIDDLKYNTTYYYCHYVYQKGEYKYGAVQNFKTKDVAAEVSVNEVKLTTATFVGNVRITEIDAIEVGILYSTSDLLTISTSGVNKQIITVGKDGNFSVKVEGLQYGTKYNYCWYIYRDGKYNYGEMKSFTTQTFSYGYSLDVTQTTATFRGGFLTMPESVDEYGILCSTTPSFTATTSGVMKAVFSPYAVFEGLIFDTKYYYRFFVLQDGRYVYGEIAEFETQDINISLRHDVVTTTTATFGGVVNLTEKDVIEVGIIYSKDPNFLDSPSSAIRKRFDDISLINSATFMIDNLGGQYFRQKYYYCYYIKQGNKKEVYGGIKSFTTSDFVNTDWSSLEDLSASESANCYIVSQSGQYRIAAVEGNNDRVFIPYVESVEVLWESFGAETAPMTGQLISYVEYKNGYIGFQVPDTYKEGNAVIAAKDANGKILWSWHIWLTDQPQEHVYKNDAGTLMDRNLGATSATAGDVGALGLLYQWGRKDPFLGSSSIRKSVEAKSTITWPSPVASNTSTGTIEYAVANPTTFITWNSQNDDWYYTGTSSTDNTRWTESDKTKSIYDPCPAGWRVPDGGGNGVWEKAGFAHTAYDGVNRGFSFSISSPSATWYPASGCRSDDDGSLNYVGNLGYYWSASPISYGAYNLNFDRYGGVYPSSSLYGLRARGLSVRCLKE